MSSLALVMIARDEARCIERCLRSAAGVVDEMRVLDTGSVDDTPAIARRCGAEVVHRAWCDDFAASRNAALDLTTCDWRLVLDADEWIGGGADSLQVWRRDATARIGLLRVVSLIDGGADGAQQSPSWLPRLLPRAVRYLGRVHEQPVSALPRQRLDLQLLHDGYLPEQMARKGGRNRQLLQQALNSDGADPYLLYQLGKDFEVHGCFAEAEPCYAQAMASADARTLWRHDLVLRRLFTLKKLGRFEAAMVLAGDEMPHWNASPDFYFTLGDLLLDWAASQPQQAPVLLPMIESSWRRALDIGENPALPDSVRGRGSFLAAHNLAVLSDGLGDAAAARRWREQAAHMRAVGDAAALAALLQSC
jgi:glycosyltransferase involved in cell wall biosynthesis